MVKYRWKLSFVLEGARCEETIRKNDWLIKNSPSTNMKRRVQLTYPFVTQNGNRSKAYTQAEEEIDAILDALAACMSFTVDNFQFPTVSEIKVVLVNEREVIKARQETLPPPIDSPKSTLKLNTKGFDKVVQALSTINTYPNQKEFRHCLRLFRRRLSYEDFFDKFFALWRAFNSLYNIISFETGEKAKIVESLTKLDQKTIDEFIKTYSKVPKSELALVLRIHGTKSLFLYFVKQGLIDDYNHNCSQDLSNALDSKNSEEIIKSTVLCLYVLRCKYAHGSDSTIMKNYEIFRIGSAFLAMLLSYFLKKFSSGSL